MYPTASVGALVEGALHLPALHPFVASDPIHPYASSRSELPSSEPTTQHRALGVQSPKGTRCASSPRARSTLCVQSPVFLKPSKVERDHGAFERNAGAVYSRHLYTFQRPFWLDPSRFLRSSALRDRQLPEEREL